MIGATLLDLLIVLAIVAILAAMTIPRVAGFLDSIAVRGAADDVNALLTTARHVALARSERVSMKIDTAARTLILLVGSDTVRRWDEGALHDVRLRSNGAAVTYSPIGMGFGATNLTMVITRGVAAETVYVSRLGRVRR
jgi:Tfp pilus assembly protein FimT